ncbi:BURP domain-containing protein, partial [Prunus dulcis]
TRWQVVKKHRKIWANQCWTPNDQIIPNSARSIMSGNIYFEWKGKGVDFETMKGRSSGRGMKEAVFVGSDRFHLWSKAAQRPRTDTLRLFNNQHLEMGSNVELIVHGVVLHPVARQGVKDLDGQSFLIGCDVAQSTQAFLRCTEEDDIYKLALVYFAELVVLGRDKHLNINVNYLTLIENLDAFNRYPWCSVSFDKTQTVYFLRQQKGRGKGKSKVMEQAGEMRRARRISMVKCKGVAGVLKDHPAVVSAESIPSSCADLDELNKVVSLLRSELFQVKRKKDVLELKVIRMEKLLDHCLGPQFEQAVRKDLALLKEMTNCCVVSHLFKGYEEVDGMQWDKGQITK